MQVKWYTESDIKGSIEKFLVKYDKKELDGAQDAELFFKAMAEAVWKSKTTDDDDKKDLWENMSTDIEEYGSIAYFIEVRGTPVKIVEVLKGEELKMGIYSDKYEPIADCKNNIWMDWTPATQKQIMLGNPNTDAQFFSGDLTVKGSLKLATKPRQTIYDFYEFIGREID